MTPPTDPSSSDKCQREALTSIHAMYTLAANDEAETSEVDRVIVRHFLETIAEISLSVASRKLNKQE
jgi:hypothetical protein